MDELYNLDISKKTIKSMLEIAPSIKEIPDKDIREKVFILKKINCSPTEIRNIISSNPLYLIKDNDSIIKLIDKLNDLGFKCLNILFDSNPYILNLEVFEINNYIINKIDNGYIFEDVINELESNPILFNDI